MKLLLEIKDEDVYGNLEKKPSDEYKIDIAARAIIFNDKNEISLLYLKKYNYHEIPGGRIEEGETLEDGLRREILEETGCDIDIIRPIGKIVEYRNKTNVLKTSTCYIAKFNKKIAEPNYEQSEIDDQNTPVWIDFNKAITLFKNSQAHRDDYLSGFIIKRDLTFLEEAKKII
jgi:8-oxo-dGTP diphosphatase